MDASDLLLDQWSQQVKEIFPSLHAYQQKIIALCVQGIIESGTAVMQRIAEILWEHLGIPSIIEGSDKHEGTIDTLRILKV